MNKRKKILLAVIVITLMIAIGQYFIIYNQVEFDGDRVCSKNPNRFYLNFNLMNKTDSQTMVLNEGDMLHVSWKIDGGKADGDMVHALIQESA